MDAKKPKGFGKFDSLMRKLVQVPPQEVHVNRHGCKGRMSNAAKEAIADAAQKLATHFRKKRK
jgi:EAL domain-containing protein (putative c-di-GMP-specific phosphodiesterase class I)